MRNQYRHLFILCLLVAVGSFAMGFAAKRYSAQKPGSRQMWLASLTGGRGLASSPSQTFAAVLESVEDSFVDKINDEKPLSYGALRQMMDELDDPNSRFLDPEETRAMLDAEDGLFHGIGAVIHIEATHSADGERRRAIVAGVLPGSPAQKAGLRRDDVIAQIDNKWVFQPYLTLPVAPRQPDGKLGAAVQPEKPDEEDFRDPEDFISFSTHDILKPLSTDSRTVSLLLLGPQEKALERVDIQTAPTAVRAAQVVMVKDGVAEVRIGGLTKTIGPELDAALGEVKRSGARQLVLDLRGCVGGPVDRMVQVGSRFVDGPLGSLDRKQNGRMTKVPLTAHRTDNAWTGPMVVLVDRGTLGTAEMLAGALAAKGRATLVGERTFGDGLEHSLITLRDGSSLLMTTGKFFGVKGDTFQAKGIVPGVAVASTPEQDSAARRVLARKG